jgi:hypothetical protein
VFPKLIYTVEPALRHTIQEENGHARAIAATGLLLAITPLGFAQPSQTEGAALEFEVASVKPWVQPPPQAGRGARMVMGQRGGL